MTKALLKNYRQSPRKVRLIADSIRGKKINDALNALQFMPKRAAEPMKKLLESAIANAKDNSVDLTDLIVKEITVDDGPTLKRSMPKWRGTAHPIRKRTSHVNLFLAVKESKKENKKSEIKKETKVVAKKTVKKAPAKKTVAKKKINKDKK